MLYDWAFAMFSWEQVHLFIVSINKFKSTLEYQMLIPKEKKGNVSITKEAHTECIPIAQRETETSNLYNQLVFFNETF